MIQVFKSQYDSSWGSNECYSPRVISLTENSLLVTLPNFILCSFVCMGHITFQTDTILWVIITSTPHRGRLILSKQQLSIKFYFLLLDFLWVSVVVFFCCCWITCGTRKWPFCISTILSFLGISLPRHCKNVRMIVPCKQQAYVLSSWATKI